VTLLLLRSTNELVGCPSGQWERTVNPPALPSVVQIHYPPLFKGQEKMIFKEKESIAGVVN
jgi:hypothetical protein